MRKSIIPGAAIVASLAFAGIAHADQVGTDFDRLDDGSVGGQAGWIAGTQYDQAVVPFGTGKALRISNEIFDGSFASMPYSTPVNHPAGENEGNNVLVNEFKFKAPDTFTDGLAVSVSPTGAGGSRMSYLRFEDSEDGVKVVFRDGANLDDKPIALLTDRGKQYTIKFETTFVAGHDNDVVRVSIDGVEKMRGGSWEDYYRAWQEINPAATDRLMWRLNLTGNAALHGNGFIFDDVTTTSSHVDNPAPLNPPAPGPQGPKGDTGNTGATGAPGAQGANGKNGTNGANGVAGAHGANGVTTIIHDRGHLTGATMRTLRVHTLKGKKLVSVRATLRGKRLHTSGRTIKVDLRGKTEGNYNVVITAKYKTKHGMLHTVRSVRTLSITHS